MKVHIHLSSLRLRQYVALALFAWFPIQGNTATECAAVSCDCTSLPSATWVDMCEKQENALQKQCKKTSLDETGYCSVHGPDATRVTLSLDTEKTSREQSNIIKLVGYKSTAVLWSINKDLAFIAHKIDNHAFDAIELRLRLLEQNTELHFNTQKQLVQLLNESNNTSEVKKAWRSYSIDIAGIASQLIVEGNRLRASTKDTDKAKSLANALLNSAGGLYEQVGYAYAQAASFKESAQAWKQAATIATNLLEIAKQNKKADEAEYFRYQAATRFLRASQNWGQSKEKEQAQNALEKSQQYITTKE
ncbi:hypothetical protein [Teredinibacter franksiae]|uniref:hypothetical protein n=1 Tax=Teredinibacter franksiae TaxID=2761453 RepID=UPI00162413E1|nr:hypothetical protein [Teredinibacter franksiae]